jgi:hypothetical protein
MREHVCVRCGEYLLLFPAENVAWIQPVPSGTSFRPWIGRVGRGRARVAPPVLDLRRLLGVRAPAPPENGVTLRWSSTDRTRELTLLVDAVEEIVNCHAGDLIDAAILPRRLRPLCDQVMHDPGGKLRLRVKPDVHVPLAHVSERRHYALSLLATMADGAP